MIINNDSLDILSKYGNRFIEINEKNLLVQKIRFKKVENFDVVLIMNESRPSFHVQNLNY